jgi:hypothetical protein
MVNNKDKNNIPIKIYNTLGEKGLAHLLKHLWKHKKEKQHLQQKYTELVSSVPWS